MDAASDAADVFKQELADADDSAHAVTDPIVSEMDPSVEESARAAQCESSENLPFA